MPFSQFDRDAFRSYKKDQLAVVEVQHLVTESDALGLEPFYLGLKVFHREADMVKAELREVADSGVNDGVGVAVL